MNCVNCGIITERKFCSYRCAGLWGARKKNEARLPKPQVKCAYCGALTENPKFCSRSCSASVTNRNYPKRKRSGLCKKCQTPILSGYYYCKSCKPYSTSPVANYTLAEARGAGNAKHGGMYPYIRTLARREYQKAGRPMSCAICGYSRHVDVCHIKGISSHEGATPVKQINNQENLIALCKNHHWELDHDFLDLRARRDSNSQP